MAKLKLGPIADDKPVKITLELPARLHRDLVAYAEILGHDRAPRGGVTARILGRGSDWIRRPRRAA